MKIALDVSSLNHRQISGVGIYTIELLRALRQMPSTEVSPFFRLSRWKSRREIEHHVGETKPWLFGFMSDAEIVHGPDFRVAAAPGKRRVVSIHDVAFFREGMTSPTFAEKKRLELESLLKHHPPDAIITISQATRRDLIHHFPSLSDRIHVVYLAGDHLNNELSFEKPDAQFLFVGNLEARKNVLGIIRGFEIHARSARAEKTRLILAGKPGYRGEEILAAVEASPVRDRIKILGYCSNEELRWHYTHSLALVFPSWVEGFGIPVVEAMLAGCPVITSSTTATAEIVGNEAWLVDPADNEAIANAMDQAFTLALNPEDRLTWVKKAQKQAFSFTWSACAEGTLDVYRKVLSK